jgi:thiol-disulfide isomerase/thioredoxin
MDYIWIVNLINGETMNLRIKSLLGLAFGMLFLFTTSAQAQNVLRVGSPAPEIKHSKWMKGTAINNFEKGNFYVVEFWATWCPPCKESIPHLTELQHKYAGKVTFIGMDGSERPKEGETPAGLVENFLKEWNDKMQYNVAMDTEDKFMMVNWMNAAAQFFIPTAFIVDKDTKIAWIGYPMEMDEPLAQILEGKFDVKAYADKFGPEQDKQLKEREEQKKFLEISKPVADAFKAKDYAKAVTECETLIAKDPSLQNKLDSYYFKALIQANPDKAMTLAQAEKAKNSDRLITISQVFAQKDLDKKFYNFVVDALTPRIEKDANDYPSLSVLARTHELLGNNAKAIEIIEKIKVYARGQGAKEEDLSSFNDRIAKLKAAK